MSTVGVGKREGSSLAVARSALRTLLSACLLSACCGGRCWTAASAGRNPFSKLISEETHPNTSPPQRRSRAELLPLRLRGGGSSLAGTGRVADLWDVHKFGSRDDGMVAVFRHARLGTALELAETRAGLAIFVENGARNASFAMVHGRFRAGEERRNRGYTPLVREGRTWWDVHEGFLAPDTLEALRDEAGERPMVAEFFDVGEGSGWEAFDDGSLPYVRIQNSDAFCEIFLTENGTFRPGCLRVRDSA